MLKQGARARQRTRFAPAPFIRCRVGGAAPRQRCLIEGQTGLAQQLPRI